MSVNYKPTISLPKTDFPMRAGLAKKEPEILARWESMDMYRRHREDAKGREKFILHDGPPYANGHLHMGHALNKILKDVIVRSQQMMGKDSNYVPGWDCHGLPIEWKIEEKYRAAGKDKDEVPVVQFRGECREFAAKWIDVQREEFKRLGGVGDWDNPYTTMNFGAEATIVREFGKFLMNGSLYKGAKPVLWSVEEKTALAEAEVEYHDHTSTTIYVRFPIVSTKASGLDGAKIVIWTTTPWTIPGNRAVAYGEDIDYALVEINSVFDGSLAVVGERMIVADALVPDMAHKTGIENCHIIRRFKGKELEGTICHHPLHGKGYDFDVPALAAHFVGIDTGTGFVHIAPGHGADDWELGIKNGIPAVDTVEGDGLFMDHVPLFAGQHVFKVNARVVEELTDIGALVASGKLVHSYPHSWRSKAPLIFRNTAQWFISMEKTGLRASALAAIETTRFVPEAGRARLHGMIESRPDWCVSRQRAWGVPLTVFVNRTSGEPLRDQKVLDRIVEAVMEEGVDAWFTSDPARFLAPDYDADDYEQVFDILDVWFDSGSTHQFVLEARDDLKWPASLYLEGSDQHRGWFHSSLLESCGTTGVAPYEAVLTHGFVMGEDGMKMSKSLGNIVSPQKVMEQHGADILRLWVVGSDYSEDLRIGPEILKRSADIYRRLRNTLRFLLGNLNEFDESERVDVSEMPELERWALHRIWEMDGLIRDACNSYHFHPMFVELHNFCAIDLSAFYFDIRKDALYCDGADSLTRRAARTVLDELFNYLTAWLAPIICFTAEEAWMTRNPGENESVHLRQFPDTPEGWRDDALAAKWNRVRDLRRVVTGALELERADKRIGSSLEAHADVYTTGEFIEAMQGVDLAEISITSSAALHEGDAPEGAFRIEEVSGVAVAPSSAAGNKCARCWKVLDDVGSDAEHTDVCPRCADAVRKHPELLEDSH